MTATGWALLAYVLASLVTLAFVGVTNDEAWFLHVVRRLRNGERLYRDVFFGAGPFAPWLAAGIFRVAVPNALGLRVMLIGYMSAIAASVAWIGSAAGLSPGAAAATVGLSFALAGPHLALHNAYGQLSTLAVLLAALAAAHGAAPWAGIALGVAICSKYPVGLAATVLFVPVLLLAHGPPALSAVAALLAVVACAAIGLGREGRRAFFLRAVRNKSSYLSTGRVSPGAGIRKLLGQAQRSINKLATALPVLVSFALVAAGALGAALALVRGISAGDTGLLLGAGLAICGLVVTIPRCNRSHVVAAVPLSLAGIVLMAGPALALDRAIVWLAIALFATSGFLGKARMALGRKLHRRVPGFERLPLRRCSGVWPHENDDLRELAGDRVFLLRPDAAFFYVAGGLTNPTLFDYPYASTFGPDGQAEVIGAIADGRVPWVCHQEIEGPLTPHELQDYVRRLTPIAEVNAGTLYRLPVREAASSETAPGQRSAP